MFDNIPNELKVCHQWCLWRLVQLPDRIAKHPFQTNGKMAKVNDPLTWSSYEACVDAYMKGGYDGLGFIFTEHDPYCGIDFDHVIDSSGNIVEWSRILLDRFNSYCEASQSGRGLHCLIRVPKAKINRRIQIGDDSGLEVYTSTRYFAVTGQRLEQYPATIEEREKELLWLTEEYNLLSEPQRTKVVAYGGMVTVTETSDWKQEDVRVLERARKKYGERFTRIMEGDLSEFEMDVSRADLSFCGMLAKVTSDYSQIERIWLVTVFGKRDKVVNRIDYRKRTIQKAMDGIHHHYECKQLADKQKTSV